LTYAAGLITFAAFFCRPRFTDCRMRADLVTVIAEIKQSLELLRRHL